MDEELSNNIEEVAATSVPTQPAQSVQPQANISSSQTPKKKSPLVIILLSLVILLIGAAVAVILIFKPFDKHSSTPPVTIEGTEITDDASREVLQKTINSLFQVSSAESSIETRDYNYVDVSLFTDGSFSQQTGINTVIDSADESEFATVSLAATPSIGEILTSLEYPLPATDEIRTISADLVADRYYRLFGSSIEEGTEAGKYIYDPSQNFYFVYLDAPNEQSRTTRYYYTSHLTETEDSIYAYVSGALLNPDENTIYCGVFNLLDDPEEKSSTCVTDTKGDDFKLDDSNYDKYEVSRLEFVKDGKDGYQFRGAEIVSSK